MSTEPGSLRAAISRLIEPWMDVLMNGLSPDLIDSAVLPAHLCTVRAGGNFPGSPWDAILLRAEGARPGLLSADLERTLPNLRGGGIVVLVVSNGSGGGVPDLFGNVDAQVFDFSSQLLDDGTTLVIGRKLVAGSQDLVGLRRGQDTLWRNVERLENLLSEVRGRRASERGVDGSWSIKEWTGHLGDLDRDGYLALLRPGPQVPSTRQELAKLVVTRDHNGRPLSELITRFRHFRWQSREALLAIKEDAWPEPATDLDGAPVTRADLIRTWVRDESCVLDRIRGLC